MRQYQQQVLIYLRQAEEQNRSGGGGYFFDQNILAGTRFMNEITKAAHVKIGNGAQMTLTMVGNRMTIQRSRFLSVGQDST